MTRGCDVTKQARVSTGIFHGKTPRVNWGEEAIYGTSIPAGDMRTMKVIIYTAKMRILLSHSASQKQTSLQSLQYQPRNVVTDVCQILHRIWP